MIKQFLDSKICLSCLGCCRFNKINSVWGPFFLQEEIKELQKNSIPLNHISSDSRIKLFPHPREKGFICCFLDIEGNKCRIYNRRPFECQFYPFLLNRRRGKIYLAVDLGCPFANQKNKSATFEKYAAFLYRYLNSTSGKALLRNNPQIVQSYKNVCNLFEVKID